MVLWEGTAFSCLLIRVVPGSLDVRGNTSDSSEPLTSRPLTSSSTSGAALNVVDGQSLYEPNQYVIACGVNDPTAGPIRISTRMKRKLNSGDFVSLLMYTTVTGSGYYSGIVSYAVKYN